MWTSPPSRMTVAGAAPSIPRRQRRGDRRNASNESWNAGQCSRVAAAQPLANARCEEPQAPPTLLRSRIRDGGFVGHEHGSVLATSGDRTSHGCAHDQSHSSASTMSRVHRPDSGCPRVDHQKPDSGRVTVVRHRLAADSRSQRARTHEAAAPVVVGLEESKDLLLAISAARDSRDVDTANTP